MELGIQSCDLILYSMYLRNCIVIHESLTLVHFFFVCSNDLTRVDGWTAWERRWIWLDEACFLLLAYHLPVCKYEYYILPSFTCYPLFHPLLTTVPYTSPAMVGTSHSQLSSFFGYLLNFYCGKFFCFPIWWEMQIPCILKHCFKPWVGFE